MPATRSARHQQHDQRGRQVEEAGHHAPAGPDGGEGGRRGQRRRQGESEVAKEAHEVARPAHRHRRAAERVLEDQVPADDPRHQLARRGVRVGVRAAGHRDHRRQLGVAQPGERACHRRDDHREHQRRAGVLGGGGPGQDEDAGADDRADAERGEVKRAERAAERWPLGLGLKVGDAAGGRESHEPIDTARRRVVPMGSTTESRQSGAPARRVAVIGQ